MCKGHVGGVDFAHELPSFVFGAEERGRRELAELLESSPGEEVGARKGAQSIEDALENLHLFVGQEQRLAGV